MTTKNEIIHLACKRLLKVNLVSILTLPVYFSLWRCIWTSPVTLFCVIFLNELCRFNWQLNHCQNPYKSLKTKNATTSSNIKCFLTKFRQEVYFDINNRLIPKQINFFFKSQIFLISRFFTNKWYFGKFWNQCLIRTQNFELMLYEASKHHVLASLCEMI